MGHSTAPRVPLPRFPLRDRMAANSKNPSQTVVGWAGGPDTTLAIVFTDIVGSTAMGVELGNDKMSEIRQAHFLHSDALLAQCGEREARQIKTIGDSVMAVFRSVTTALDYALALHLNPGRPELQVRGVRAGIHVGSVEVGKTDVFGIDVMFAARVVHVIDGAEIWLSHNAMEHLIKRRPARHKRLRWQPHRGIALKGIPGSFTLWSLSPAIAPSGLGQSTTEIARNWVYSAQDDIPSRLTNPTNAVDTDVIQLSKQIAAIVPERDEEENSNAALGLADIPRPLLASVIRDLDACFRRMQTDPLTQFRLTHALSMAGAERARLKALYAYASHPLPQRGLDDAIAAL